MQDDAEIIMANFRAIQEAFREVHEQIDTLRLELTQAQETIKWLKKRTNPYANYETKWDGPTYRG